MKLEQRMEGLVSLAKDTMISGAELLKMITFHRAQGMSCLMRIGTRIL